MRAGWRRRGVRETTCTSFSRAIYRELAGYISWPRCPAGTSAATSGCCGPARRPSSALRPTATTSPGPHARCSTTSGSTSRCARSTAYGTSLTLHGVRRRVLQRQPTHGFDINGNPLAVPRDDAEGHGLPADAAASQRLLPVAPAPRRDRGGRASAALGSAASVRAGAQARPSAARVGLRAMLLGVDVGGTFTDAVLAVDGRS